jgi:hypothetical protein
MSLSSDPDGGWAGLSSRIGQIVAASEEPFTTQTIENARDLLNLLKGRCPIPELEKGYWSTFSFFWPQLNFEIEVFGERLEVYRFYDRRTRIWEEPHAAGDKFSEKFIAELPLR